MIRDSYARTKYTVYKIIEKQKKCHREKWSKWSRTLSRVISTKISHVLRHCSSFHQMGKRRFSAKMTRENQHGRIKRAGQTAWSCEIRILNTNCARGKHEGYISQDFLNSWKILGITWIHFSEILLKKFVLHHVNHFLSFFNTNFAHHVNLVFDSFLAEFFLEKNSISKGTS